MTRLARTAFVVSSLFLLALIAFVDGRYRLFPTRYLGPAIDQSALVVGTALLEQPPHYAEPARFDWSGVRVARGEDAPEGVTLLTSYWERFDGQQGVMLIDGEGRFLHGWPTIGKYVHGTWLLEDGDLIYTSEYAGAARVGPDRKMRWILTTAMHHSIHRTERGTFWLCETARLTEPDEIAGRLDGIELPVHEDSVTEVDADGNVLRKISILQVLYDSPHRSRLFQREHQLDLLHVNDVEPLPASLADEYPLFDAGDLVVSIRYLDLVLVLDPDTRRILWADSGRWIGQHDPDWIGDGWISVYDNQSRGEPEAEWSGGSPSGGSRLVAIRPHTREFRVRYPNEATEERFFTGFGGKAQLLDDGHWLITEPESERVFEVDENGREVWTWVQERMPNGECVAEVLEGMRYPMDPAAVESGPKPDGWVDD
jgi:hypothetical protein